MAVKDKICLKCGASFRGNSKNMICPCCDIEKIRRMAICKYFGVRTPNRSRTTQCKSCQESDFELFRKCTFESNVLMSTSIDVDKKGNTVEIPPAGQVNDTELITENFNLFKKEED